MIKYDNTMKITQVELEFMKKLPLGGITELEVMNLDIPFLDKMKIILRPEHIPENELRILTHRLVNNMGSFYTGLNTLEINNALLSAGNYAKGLCNAERIQKDQKILADIIMEMPNLYSGRSTKTNRLVINQMITEALYYCVSPSKDFDNAALSVVSIYTYVYVLSKRSTNWFSPFCKKDKYYKQACNEIECYINKLFIFKLKTA